MDNAWPSIEIEASEFSTAKPDDKFIVTVSKADNSINTGWQWGPQVFINVIIPDNWQNLKDAPTQSISPTSETTEVAFPITQNGLDQIALGTGIAVQGMNVVITKVELFVAPVYQDEAKTLTTDDGFIAASEFEGLSDWAKVVFTYNIAGDVSGYNNWGIGRIGSNDDAGDGPSVELASIAVSTSTGEFSTILLMSDIKKALAATPDGIYVNFWNFGNGKCTASLVKVESFDVVSEDGGEESATPVSISWGADDIADKGTLNGKTFGEDFKLTITDTNASKLEIDANNAYFGDATTQIKFTHRLKTGGKSDSKNNMTLTIPSDGTLKVYVRTGSNSATDRNLVLTQNGTELYNKVVLESDAVEVKGLDTKEPDKETKVYPIISVSVKAGTVDVTYPTNSLNFYGFEFIGTTGIQETIAPAKAISNGAIYNLAGQKVNENYKGIVIKDGKKFFQK
ncbi:MAG: hypothetical protein IJ069_04650 [Prevotella sp.]|nr:hypothetical protein [Prevotella sp.]